MIKRILLSFLLSVLFISILVCIYTASGNYKKKPRHELSWYEDIIADYLDDTALIKNETTSNACSYFLYSKSRPGVYSSIDLCVLDSQPKMNFMENKALTQLERLAKAFKSSLAYYDEAYSFVDSFIETDYFLGLIIKEPSDQYSREFTIYSTVLLISGSNSNLSETADKMAEYGLDILHDLYGYPNEYGYSLTAYSNTFLVDSLDNLNPYEINTSNHSHPRMIDYRYTRRKTEH